MKFQPKFDKILTKEYLVEEYIEKKLTPKEIANNINTTKSTIYKYLKKHNIKQRKRNGGIDIEQKFNKLTTIKVLGQRPGGKTYIWLCKCDCGNKNLVKADTTQLKSGAIKSCGCEKKIRKTRNNENYFKYKDILTKEFIIEEYIKKNKKCEEIAKEIGCSITTLFNYIKIYKINIKKNENKRPKKGDIFNNLVVEGFSHTKNGRLYYKTKCLCGNQKIIITSMNNLKYGNIKSCGCMNKGYNSPLWKGYKEISGEHWKRIKNGAISRNYSFDINIEDIWEKFESQNRKCALSGINLHFNKKHTTASLDRIDNNKGYDINNVWWIHKDINMIKNNYTLEKFLHICKLVSNPLPIIKSCVCIEDIYHCFWKKIIQSAKDRNIIFNITINDGIELYKKQNGLCAITNQILIFPKNNQDFRNRKKFNASLDRIDSKLGYTKDNIQWTDTDINMCRMNYDLNYFKYLCKLITNNYIKNIKNEIL